MRDALRYFSSKDPWQGQKIEDAYEEQMERLRGAEQLPGGAAPLESLPTESADGSVSVKVAVKKSPPAQPAPAEARSPAPEAKGAPLKGGVSGQSNDVVASPLQEPAK